MDETGAAALDLRTGRGLLRAEEAGGGLVRVNMGPPELTWDRVPLARAMDLDALPLDGAPGRGRHGQPALRLRGRGRRGGRRRRHRRAGRARPAVPGAHQRRVRAGDRPRDHPDAGLGARRHDHARLRLGRLRRGGGDGAARADRAAGHGAARRRRARDRLARRRGLDDRADGAGVRGPAGGGLRRGGARERAGLRHPRLPAERLRDRGDEGAGRGAPASATRWWSTAAPSPPRRCARRGSRSGGCGATIPAARVVVTGCAAQTEAGGLRGDARGRPRARQRREAAARGLGAAGGRRRGAGRGRRHHGRDAGPRRR